MQPISSSLTSIEEGTAMKIATQLPISPGGIGGSAATSDLEANKTIIATQISGGIWIEASADGVNFLRVARLDSSNEIQAVTVAATKMRVVGEDASSNASSVYVIAEQGRIRAGVIPGPVTNGAGPPIDVGSFGSLMSFYVRPLHETAGPSGANSVEGIAAASTSAAPDPPPSRPQPGFPGETPPVHDDLPFHPAPSISLQISADGAHWLNLKSFHTAEYFTQEIRARYFRVVAHGLTGSIAFASEEPVNVARAFVFRPGGVEDRNVFTDWSTLITAMSSVQGRKMLEFDDSMAPVTAPSLEPSCVIPPGTWPMKDVVWSGYGPRSSPFAFRTLVDIADGAVFTDLRMIGGQITVRNNATTVSPVSDFVANTNADQIHIGMRDDSGNPHLTNLGTKPMFALGSVSVRFFVQNCLFGMDSKTPLIGHTGGICTLILLGQNQTAPNLVASAPGATVQFSVLSTCAAIGADQTAITNAGGRYLIRPFGRIQRELVPKPPLPPATQSQDIVDNLNTLVLCNGTAALTQTLPKIVGGFKVRGKAMETGGQEIIVAEVAGGGKLKVAPENGDTIDGGTTAVAIAANGSRTFISNGEKNWITISVVS
jgi:hypothetical protein